MNGQEDSSEIDSVGKQHPAAEFDASSASLALRLASETAGLGSPETELIRLGEHAMFRLAARPVIVRVSRAVDRLPAAEREVGVARWLASEGVPAIRALDVEQPVIADGRVVTFWESANDREEYGTPVELAVLLRQLHALTAPEELHLPPVDAFGKARQRIEQVQGLSDADRAFMRERCEELATAYDHLTYELPPGVVHGDASVGNVIRDREGRPILADLDGFAIGAREWDLVLTALYYENFGWHTDEEYAGFVQAYGFDVMSWPGYETLRDVREFLMVTWLSQNAAGSPKVAAELAKRIEDLRTGSSRRDWDPF